MYNADIYDCHLQQRGNVEVLGLSSKEYRHTRRPDKQIRH
jgi:hypothetical protein